MTDGRSRALEKAFPMIVTALRQRFGLVTTDGRRSRVLAAMKRVIDEFGLSGPNELLAYVVGRDAASEASERFLSLVTIHESYFFRDERALAALSTRIAPLLAAHRRERRRLRVWSVGCARGEEVFTLAFVLSNLEALKGFTIEILGTDLDARCIEAATRARYGGASLRACSPEDLARYFEPRAPGEYEVKPSYRASVRFAVDNVVAADLPVRAGPFDLVVCRNVGLYLDAAAIASMHCKIARNLAPSGVAILGVHEPRPREHLERVPDVDGEVAVYRRARFHPDASDATTDGDADDRAHLARGSSVRRSAERRTSERGARPSSAPEPPLAGTSPRTSTPDADSLLRRATELADAHALADALGLATACIDARPLDPRAYSLAAMVLDELGRTDEAESLYRRALYLDPSSPEIGMRLQLLLRRRTRARDPETATPSRGSRARAPASCEETTHRRGPG